MKDIKIVTLKNGKRVANFSSPHDFKFDDRTVLPKVSDHIAKMYSIKFEEHDTKERVKGDKRIGYFIPRHVQDRMEKFNILFHQGKLDVVYISLPMMLALRNNGWTDEDILKSPYRTIRTIGNRMKKVVSSSIQVF